MDDAETTQRFATGSHGSRNELNEKLAESHLYLSPKWRVKRNREPVDESLQKSDPELCIYRIAVQRESTAHPLKELNKNKDIGSLLETRTDVRDRNCISFQRP